MDELTTSTLLFVIATALISLAFSTDMLGADQPELHDLRDAVSQADQNARLIADNGDLWAHADLSSRD